jgi:glycosyltransferase involved in cell wall biosynthesis
MFFDPFLNDALVFMLLRLGIILINLGGFPVLGPYLRGDKPSQRVPAQTGPTADLGSVSLLIPARNEALNLIDTLPKLLAQPVDEVVLLDDGSTDGTAELVEQLAAGDARVRLIAGQPLPPGWLGKSWACHQLAEAARGKVLVFSDADVHWEKDTLQGLLPHLGRAGLLSVFPRQRTHSLAERVLVPLLDVTLLSTLPYWWQRSRFALGTIANGQVMVFERNAYWASGGHAAVRGAVLEDVALAQRIKQLGKPVGLLLGGSQIGVRMYRSYPSIQEGFGKNLPNFHLGNPILLLISLVGHLVIYSGSWVLGFVDPLWWIVGWLGLFERLLVNHKTGRETWEALLVPLAPVFSIPVYWRALRPRYTWKGRVYPRTQRG